MKRILAPILLLTLLFPTFAFGETMKDLVKRDGIYYKKFSTVPFTGTVKGLEQGKFRNGKKQGLWVAYHPNGQLWAKEAYRNGKRNGHWVGYYPSGRLMFKGTYKDERKEGSWVWYNKDGTPSKDLTGTYRNDVKVSD